MVFLLLNLFCATMEEIYERFGWFYSTIRHTVVSAARGSCYQLTQLTQMSRRTVPYPECCTKMRDCEQNALLQIFFGER